MSRFYSIFIFFLITNIAQSAEWSYDNDTGPDHWGENYPTCNGHYQSPIDIERQDVRSYKFSPLTFFNFNSTIPMVQASNNGHTAVFNISQGWVPEISGGPLDSPYAFEQFHFHWGTSDTNGSEDTIGNTSYAMELHIVFYKEEYGSYENALNEPDGLCVLAFLFKVCSYNPNSEVITKALSYIQQYESSVYIRNFPPIGNLLYRYPSKYYAYKGSLTTPPCSEVVIWLEFPETIPISHDQIEQFRNLLDEHNNAVTHNTRPSQPLNGRKIYLSPVN